MAIWTPSLPKVTLERAQWIRMIVVGCFVVLAAARVAPDLIRAVVPLGEFDYVTNIDGVVTRASGDRLHAGDRILVSHIKPFDRKGGLIGAGYTYDNPDRVLPVERAGRVLLVHLHAKREPVAGRVLAVLRVCIFLTIVVLGAILFLVSPRVATGAILVYCLCNEGPSTWLALQIPNPWRRFFDGYAMFSIGAAGPALLLFAFTLLASDGRRGRIAATIAGAIAIVCGALHAYAYDIATYTGRAASGVETIYTGITRAIAWLTIVIFVAAFVRAHGRRRRRIGWMVGTFALAASARIMSSAFYPERLMPWENGLLLSASVLPIFVVWYAAIRDRFFNIDLVVSRAVVYVALSATVIGVITATEEIGTYVFYQNTDLAYGFLIVISMVVGSTTGKLREVIEYLVDRFIFRDRHTRRHALELIGGYVLDAETEADVERALLEDAAHALDLAFGGIMRRGDDGAFRLGANYRWPPECIVELGNDHALLDAVRRTRGSMRFSGKDSRLIEKTFANERLTFAAPLFVDRTVNAIVVYGHSKIGLDLDPEEREALIEVVAHASLALGAIELARYRALVASMPDALVAIEAHAPERVRDAEKEQTDDGREQTDRRR